METRAHHVLIGLFTVLAISASLVFGLWLSRSSHTQDYRNYEIVFKEPVTGLSEGAAVRYSGIKVGAVTRLLLDPHDPRRVIARVQINADAPVRTDTRAKLAMSGVTGIATIQLSGGAPNSPPLQAKPGQLPIIVAELSPLTKLLASGEDIISSINQMVVSTNRLLSDENMQRVSRTLEHIDQATGAIADQREDIRRLLQQLAEASRSANTALQEAEKLMRQANGLMDTEGRASMASLARVTANLDQLLQNNHQSLESGMQGLGELGPAIRELRQTLEAVRAITRRLNENPSGYLLGRDKSKEFEP
jgi:phospholipid/cholesterol/gamma-HCH transport system substrate-binding protein